MVDKVENRFYEDCLKDAPQYQTSRIFFLKTQAKDRGYIERTEHKVESGTLGEDVRKLLDEVDGSRSGQPGETGSAQSADVADASAPATDQLPPA
jgi:hypothetical protein